MEYSESNAISSNLHAVREHNATPNINGYLGYTPAEL